MIKKSKFLFIHHGLVIPIHILLLVLCAYFFSDLKETKHWIYTIVFAILHAFVFVQGFKIFKSWRDKKIFFQSLYYRYFPNIPYDLFFALVVPFSLSLNYILLVEESLWMMNSYFTIILHNTVALISFNWILINMENGIYMQIRSQLKPTQTKIKSLQKEVLHDMISPHFLFNSLNTLTSIVPESKGKAILFTSELAYLYEFILLNNNRELITIEEEINVLNRYIFLLKSRFEDNLQVNIDLPKEVLSFSIPTLTLQNLVENAIKHNVISKKYTLIIDIKFEDDCIIIQNPINLKSNSETSTGLGLEYIYKQYHKYFNDNVLIQNDNQYFTVKLPTKASKELLQTS
jgi:two-component system LytT family sensor kinase